MDSIILGRFSKWVQRIQLMVELYTLENAVFVINDSDKYTIIKTPLAIHDLDKNIIKGDKEVTIDVYKYNSEEGEPLHAYSASGFTLSIKGR